MISDPNMSIDPSNIFSFLDSQTLRKTFFLKIITSPCMEMSNIIIITKKKHSLGLLQKVTIDPSAKNRNKGI